MTYPKTSLVLLLTSVLLLSSNAGAQTESIQRSVIDSEYGQYYGYGPSSTQVGLAVLQPHSQYFAGMTGESIKAPHGHFQHFAPNDPGDDFPYHQLKTFEAAEIAAGRPPIFITATYQGKNRPVYFEWHLALDGSLKPTAQPAQWSQAVNIRDDRFILFYINAYLRSTLWKPSLQQLWHAVDNCAFRYNNYGVLDDAGIYHNSIVWDKGFAQNESEFLDSIKYFLKRVKELAPDVFIIGNEGSMNDESRFADVWSGFDGTIREDITNSFAGDDYSRNALYLSYQRYQWEGPAGKAALLRALLPPASDDSFVSKMRTSYAAYLIFRGFNFFFGPRFDDGTTNGVPQTSYADMVAALGLPVGNAMDSSTSNDGKRLYWRSTEGGIVYLNWTGAPQTVALRSGASYFDRNGARVSTLTIPDLQGDYVLLQAGARAERPIINPRRTGVISGPLPVNLSTISGDQMRYTLDGTEPTTFSPLYLIPIALTASATVKAKAFCSGCVDSFTASEQYTIASVPVQATFTATSGSATKFGFPDYALIRLSTSSGNSSTVSYSVTGGTALGSSVDVSSLSGSLSFAPGERYKAIPISLPSTPAFAGKTVVLSLRGGSGTTVGTASSFTYTIGGAATGIPVTPHIPIRGNGLPSGTLPSTTTTARLSLTTDNPASCRYAPSGGLAFAAMTNHFDVDEDVIHSSALSALQPGTSYKFYVRCQDKATLAINADDFNISFAVAPAVILTVAKNSTIRLRAGSGSYTDHADNVWMADQYYYGGTPAQSKNTVSGTPDPALYQTERRNPGAYELIVPNGYHVVTLSFAENQFHAIKQRVFDVSINGIFVLQLFDIFAQAGATAALDKTFMTYVDNGQLAIQFYGETGVPTISAIRVD